jgi:hypothetical protein
VGWARSSKDSPCGTVLYYSTVVTSLNHSPSPAILSWERGPWALDETPWTLTPAQLRVTNSRPAFPPKWGHWNDLKTPGPLHSPTHPPRVKMLSWTRRRGTVSRVQDTSTNHKASPPTRAVSKPISFQHVERVSMIQGKAPMTMPMTTTISDFLSAYPSLLLFSPSREMLKKISTTPPPCRSFLDWSSLRACGGSLVHKKSPHLPFLHFTGMGVCNSFYRRKEEPSPPPPPPH